MTGTSEQESAPWIAKLMVLLCGLLLLCLGAWSFFEPGIFTQLYGIEVANSTAKIALRAMMGGGEIGLGLYILVGGNFNISHWSRLTLATFVFGSVFVARAFAVLLDWPNITEALIRELTIEGLIVVGLLVGVRLTVLADRHAR